MTAEVAVLNRIGVALAADSAVTVGRDANKIWTSADKLFQLSEADPVAIMIYGNADFVGIPWETIVKCYRQEHGRESREHLVQHADSFFSYISGHGGLFPPQARHEYMAASILSSFLRFRGIAKSVLDTEAEERDGLDAEDVRAIYDLQVARILRNAHSYPRLDGFTVKDQREIRSRFEAEIADCYNAVFGQLPLSPRATAGIKKLAAVLLTRQCFGNGRTGIVFAGFGSREYLPSLMNYEIEGMALERPRIVMKRHEVISSDNNAAVVPFAQQEVVHSFMSGIEPKLEAFVKKATRKMFSASFEKLFELVNVADPSLVAKFEALRPQLDAIAGGIERDLAKQKQRYWGPVVTNIATLPKDELASMAEAFVNLTKFRRRVAIERETVGGPIDVAVVTKGDGLVWVKRKHYFDPQLNPRAMSRFR